MTETAPKHVTGNYFPSDLVIILSLHACLFWTLAAANLPLAHDTMINFQMFGTVYREFLLSDEFPLWLPFTSQGVTADFAYAFTFTPAFYAAVFLGKLFSVTDTLLLFRFGLYLEETLLIYGLYQLSSLFHRHRISPIIVGITGVLSVSWGTQIHWNFHLIYLYPLLLYHTARYLRGEGLEHLAFALIAMTLGGLFYTQIFIAATLGAFVCIWLLLFRPQMPSLLRFAIPNPGGQVIVCVALVIAFMNVQFARHVIDGMQSFTSLRQANGSVGLDIFLTYGGYVSPVKFMEFIYAAPVRFAFVAYSGLFTILFVTFALIHARTKAFGVFVLLVGLVLLFSLGASGGVAEIAYRFFPTMDKFRHIGFVTPVAKILLIVASGFGIDHYLENRSARGRNTLFLTSLAIALGAVFVMVDAEHGWQYAYASDSSLDIPFAFHYWQWAIVVLFVLVAFGLGTKLVTRDILGPGLLVCVLLEMMSYKFMLEWRAPAMTPNWFRHWQSLRHAYDVRPLLYSSMRRREIEQDIIHQLSLMEVWGARNSLGYGSLSLDLCFPVHRVDMISTPFDSLIRTRLAVTDGQSPQEYFTLGSVVNDTALMAAIGCETPKLYLARTPVLTDNDAQVRHIINNAATLYETPVVQTSHPGWSDAMPTSSSAISTDVITIRRFSANQLIANIEIPAGSNRFLIYLDSLHPGWHAQIDGHPAPILPANIAFKALELTPGYHEVAFRFTGGSRWTAATIWINYLLTIVLLLTIVGVYGRYMLSRITSLFLRPNSVRSHNPEGASKKPSQ
ncbi:hypothetical protein JWZ98_02790 [Methylomonas sp. EFPC1]|uniref:hypothetical protein n=1 Tax=Methylomonas sp. EFPC1 TaxID=2812647 RepID=UPI001968096F|nr:hypothetical protein [Methylomonas sp. EFPC1]QSB01903.1 hypothetical protein JWZ98_02790 [Methylomonas sp. EFPC1]